MEFPAEQRRLFMHRFVGRDCVIVPCLTKSKFYTVANADRRFFFLFKKGDKMCVRPKKNKTKHCFL